MNFAGSELWSEIWENLGNGGNLHPWDASGFLAHLSLQEAERRVVAVPELRGGLLQHALKKITEATGLLLTLRLLPNSVRS